MPGFTQGPLEILEPVSAIEPQRRLHLLDRLQVTAHVEQLPRRRQAALEQCFADATAARRVGLDLSTVKPQPVIEGDTFDTYRYQVAVIGDYHSLGEFLANVGSLTRIVAPVNLALGPLANTAALEQRKKTMKNNNSVLDSRFELQTYVAKTAAPRPASAGGSKS